MSRIGLLAVLVAVVACEETAGSGADTSGEAASGASARDEAGAAARESERGAGGSPSPPAQGDDGFSGESCGGCGDDVTPPECKASDVAVAADSALVLGNTGVHPRQLRVDAEGNSYVAGSIDAFAADVDWGSVVLTGSGHLFLLKLDRDGALIWGKRFGSDGQQQLDSPDALALTHDGEVLVAGQLGAAPGEFAAQLFVARFDSNGALLRQFEVPTPGAAISNVIEDFAGDIVVWGNFRAPWTLGATTLPGALDWNIFEARFAADGNVLGAKQFESDVYDGVEDVVLDQAGNSYIASNVMVVSQQSRLLHGTLRALDPSLELLWQRDLGEQIYARKLALADGKLIAVGDGAPFVKSSSGDALMPDPQLVIGQLEPATGETLLWRVHRVGFSAVPNPMVTSLAVAPDSSLIVGGAGEDGWLLGGAALRSGGSSSPLVARFTPTGEYVWSTLFCSDGLNAATVAVSYAAGRARALVTHDGYLELGAERVAAEGTALVTLPAQAVEQH